METLNGMERRALYRLCDSITCHPSSAPFRANSASMRASKPKDAAASPLRDWIHTSAIRTKPSLTDFKLSGSADEIRQVRWFARGASDELLSHPLLGRLTMAERNGLYAARLVHFLDDMALTETRIVMSRPR